MASFNIEPYFISSSRNPIGLQVLPDSTWQTFDDYYLKLVIETESVWRSGTFSVRNLDIRQSPNPEGVVNFNLSRPLNQALNSERPEWVATTPKIATNSIKRYRYSIEEYIDGALNQTITGDIKHVVRGGFNYIKGQYLQEYVNSLKFLTHQPRSKISSRHASEFLYYLNPSLTGTLEIYADLVFEDDSTQNAYQPGISMSVEPGDLIIFPVGYFAMGLDQFVTPPVKSYEVYLASNLSEKMKYEIDCTYQPRERFYLFENSLGGYDTVRTTGRMTESETVESQTAQKALPVFYDSSQPQIIHTQTQNQAVFSQHTGILSLEGAKWLKDLLRTDDAVRIGDTDFNHFADGQYWPISISRGDKRIREDDDFLYGFPFNYSDAFINPGT